MTLCAWLCASVHVVVCPCARGCEPLWARVGICAAVCSSLFVFAPLCAWVRASVRVVVCLCARGCVPLYEWLCASVRVVV